MPVLFVHHLGSLSMWHPVYRSPYSSKLPSGCHHFEIYRNHDRRCLPSGEKVRRRRATRVTPRIEYCLRCGGTEVRTARTIDWCSVLKRCTCNIICLSRTLHVVEEWIVAKTGEDSKCVLLAFESRGTVSIAVHVVFVAGPAFNVVADIEPANNRGACRGFAEL